jgi:hypothetical protein
MVFCVGLVLVVGVPWAGPFSAPDRPETRARMRAIYEALATALDLSLDRARFEDPESREGVLDALGALAENAEALDAHGLELGESLGFLRWSLVRDVNEAILRFRQGQYEGTRFLIGRLTESCVACHTKLPADGNATVEPLLRRADVAALPFEERLRLALATRQFDAALEALESRFASPDESATGIASGGMLTVYLEVCLRVRGDYARAIATLERLGGRPDLPRFFVGHLEQWLRTLRQMQDVDPAGAEMDIARRLVRDARAHNIFPADRHGTADFVIASGLLQRHLAANPTDLDEVAEAFYLLGVCDSHLSQSYWVSETAHYLEAAIRTRPSSPYARLAYDFLESYVTMEFTGSGGMRIPEDVQHHLDALRRLVHPQ